MDDLQATFFIVRQLDCHSALFIVNSCHRGNRLERGNEITLERVARRKNRLNRRPIMRFIFSSRSNGVALPK
jgi:hypothetical protein